MSHFGFLIYFYLLEVLLLLKHLRAAGPGKLPERLGLWLRTRSRFTPLSHRHDWVGKAETSVLQGEKLWKREKQLCPPEKLRSPQSRGGSPTTLRANVIGGIRR